LVEGLRLKSSSPSLNSPRIAVGYIVQHCAASSAGSASASRTPARVWPFAGSRDAASPRMRATRLKPTGGAERRSVARCEAEPWETSEGNPNPRMRVIEGLLLECIAGVQPPARRSRAAASRALVVRVTLTQRSASLDAPRWALGGSPALRACRFSGLAATIFQIRSRRNCGSPIVQAVVSWKKARERPNSRAATSRRTPN
jgi:hypothetical protein